MKNNPVGWFEIYVDDLDRAKLFYESVFKVELEKLESPVTGVEMFAFPMEPEQTGAPGALVKMTGFKPNGNSTLVYFSCEDCAIEAGRVLPAGGKIEQEKTSIGEYGYMVLAYDSEGNMFGLHSQQ